MTDVTGPDRQPATGRVYVLDESGALHAHECAREQALVPRKLGQLLARWEVFDAGERTSCFVGATGCVEVRWMAVGRDVPCPVQAVAPFPPVGLWQAGATVP